MNIGSDEQPGTLNTGIIITPTKVLHGVIVSVHLHPNLAQILAPQNGYPTLLESNIRLQLAKVGPSGSDSICFDFKMNSKGCETLTGNWEANMED
uniref:Uncharacterized protein n=1 Tax=Physcomitrium patens TaxID=3218 RepID=A0A2K1JRH1_PHYPA|nr:hypothetical protein PHYPA_016518 [Physcomitrium patens]